MAAFQRQGQSWYCTSGLPSDIVVEVGEMSFHLHKFPLLSRSGVIERLIARSSEEEKQCINLSDMPGGAKTFELVAKFCYGIKLELEASNVVYLRCAAENLEMTEEYGEDNLIAQTETFLHQVVLKSWKNSLQTLQTCDNILLGAEDLKITTRCIESLATKASSDKSLFGWPIMDNGGPMQSPDGSVLWNGISTGAKSKLCTSDWWYDDISTLSLPFFKRLISSMQSHGVKPEIISGSLIFYAKKYLPGLNRRQGLNPVTLGSPPSEKDQTLLLEEIEALLPIQNGLVPTKFLRGLLLTAFILKAKDSSVSNLEKRIGMQLDQATLEDLLMPNFLYSVETLYNVDCVHRILEHFVAVDQAKSGASPCSDYDGQVIGSPCLTPVIMVAKLIDGYLAEVAPDVNLKLLKFQALVAAVPEYGRPLDDGLYRAIDIYLKSHPWLSESEKEQLCRLMDCQKLSLEACTHAAQNERLPIRIVVQVLFIEQLQLRSSIASCFSVSDNLERSSRLRSGSAEGEEGSWAASIREKQVLKVGMDSMRMRVYELEQECCNMRQEMEKLGRAKGFSNTWAKLFGVKSQICSARELDVSNKNNNSGRKFGKTKQKKI